MVLGLVLMPKAHKDVTYCFSIRFWRWLLQNSSHYFHLFFWEPTVWGNFPIYATRLICWREAMCCHRRLPTWLMALIEIHFLSIRGWHSLSHTPPLCSPFIYRETQAAAAASLLSLKQQRSKQSRHKVQGRRWEEKKRKKKRETACYLLYSKCNV